MGLPLRLSVGAVGAVMLLAVAHAGELDAPAAAVPLRLELVARDLREPVALVGAPKPGSPLLYVGEQAGRIRVLSKGRVLETPFLDIRSTVARGGLRGLLSFAFHPRYLANGRFFVLYVRRGGDVHVAEYRARSGVGSVASGRVLLVVKPHNRGTYSHFGGHLAFGPDGRLYASFGDGSLPSSAQDMRSLSGKLVRLDVDVPVSRPKPEIVALGLRNPWRFSFYRGAILIGDVGGNVREEIDVLPPRLFGKANFGWHFAEGTVRRQAVPPDVFGRIVEPALEYSHARKGRCYSVTGGYVYRGSSAPRLRGRYVFGDLCGGFWSAHVRGHRLLEMRREPLVLRATLSTFGEDSRGELYIVAYNAGAVYRVAG